MTERRRRFAALLTLAVAVLVGVGIDSILSRPPLPVINGATTSVAPAEVKQQVEASPDSKLAGNLLEKLPVHG